MDLLGDKVIAMALTGLVPIILSVLPLIYRAKFVPKNQDISTGWRAALTSVLLCFGAGILLATALVHMLPEVHI